MPSTCALGKRWHEMMRTTRVPDKVTAPIRRLCNRVHIASVATFVSVGPEPGGGLCDCFAIVDRKVERAGGSVCYGWTVWFLPGIMVEGEFHAVWRSPDGELLDVTPNPLNSDRILFITDPKRKYEGKQVDNIRVPLSKDPRVREFIELARERFLVMNEGDLAYQIGEVAVDGRKLVPIMQRMHQLAQELGIGITVPTTPSTHTQ